MNTAFLTETEVSTSFKYIMDCIHCKEDILKVLRLACLYSLTNNGLKEKNFNMLRRGILVTYGLSYGPNIDQLSKLGTLKYFIN